jgi:hypothetical protein
MLTNGSTKESIYRWYTGAAVPDTLVTLQHATGDVLGFAYRGAMVNFVLDVTIPALSGSLGVTPYANIKLFDWYSAIDSGCPSFGSHTGLLLLGATALWGPNYGFSAPGGTSTTATMYLRRATTGGVSGAAAAPISQYVSSYSADDALDFTSIATVDWVMPLGKKSSGGSALWVEQTLGGYATAGGPVVPTAVWLEVHNDAASNTITSGTLRFLLWGLEY